MDQLNEKFQALDNLLRTYKNEEKQPWMVKYMKNLFPFIGVPSPQRNEALKIFMKEFSPKNRKELIQWVELLWIAPEREFQYIGMEFFFKFRKLWESQDSQFIEYLIVSKSWWDSVDFIAASIVGEYFKRFPNMFEPCMEAWISNSNMWLNRTAMICQLKYRKNTNTDWLVKSILPHTESKEFFHQKAIGWALRQYAKTDADWVKKFVNETELKPLSKREALKHLN